MFAWAACTSSPGPFAVTLTLGIPGEPAMAQSARYVVTGVEQNIEVGNWQITARDRLAWLEAFNEWLARCGLEWAGHPGPDRFVNNVGEQAAAHSGVFPRGPLRVDAGGYTS